MKNIIVAILVSMAMFSAQSAHAADTSNPFYLGFSGTSMTNDPNITQQEAGMLSQPQSNGAARSATSSRHIRTFLVGYEINDWAGELEYFGFDPGASSIVSGSYAWTDQYGQPSSTSYSYTQKTTTSGWGISGRKAFRLNESVKIFGRLGLMKMTTETEQRISYSSKCTLCTNDGSANVKTTSVDKTSVQIGVGLSANVYDGIDAVGEILKANALGSDEPLAIKVGLTWHL